jgi:hypothetical protein
MGEELKNLNHCDETKPAWDSSFEEGYRLIFGMPHSLQELRRIDYEEFKRLLKNVFEAGIVWHKAQLFIKGHNSGGGEK